MEWKKRVSTYWYNTCCKSSQRSGVKLFPFSFQIYITYFCVILDQAREVKQPTSLHRALPPRPLPPPPFLRRRRAWTSSCTQQAPFAPPPRYPAGLENAAPRFHPHRRARPNLAIQLRVRNTWQRCLGGERITSCRGPRLLRARVCSSCERRLVRHDET